MEGKGFRIDDLRVEKPATDHRTSSPFFEIYEGFVHAPTTMANLVAGQVNVQAIDIRGAKLTITRSDRACGILRKSCSSWQAMQPVKQPEIALRFVESEIRVIDGSQTPPFIGSFRDITLDIDPVVHQQRKLLQFTGSFSGSSLGLDFTAYLDPAKKLLYGYPGGQARFSRDILKLFPSSLSSSVDDLQLDGILRLQGSADGDLSGGRSVRFELQGQVCELSVDDRRLPLPLRDCMIDFAVRKTNLISLRHGPTGAG